MYNSACLFLQLKKYLERFAIGGEKEVEISGVKNR